jgi:hypothetical protein
MEKAISKGPESTAKQFSITEDEIAVLEKFRVLDKLKKELGAKFEINTIEALRKKEIKPNLKIYLLVNQSVFGLPKDAMIILHTALLKEMVGPSGADQIHKDYFFYEVKEENNIPNEIL